MPNQSLTPQAVPQDLEIVETYTEIHALRMFHTESKKPLVLHGVGGSGKTTALYQYANMYRNDYDYWAFFRFQNSLPETLALSSEFVKNLVPSMADKVIPFKQKITEIKQAIRKLKGTKLLLIDGLDQALSQEERQLLATLSQKCKCRILISSRNQLENCKCVPMFRMNLIDAQYIYKASRRVGADDVPTNADNTWQSFEMERTKEQQEERVKTWQCNEHEIALIEYVKRHPLLLELLGKTIRKSQKYDAASVLELLQKQDLEDNQIAVADNKTQIQQTIQAHLNVLWDISELPQLQKDILLEMTFLPNIYIGYDFLEKLLLKPTNKKKLSFFSKIFSFFSKKTPNKTQRTTQNIEQAIINLKATGWLQGKKQQIFIHPAVQLSVSQQLEYTKDTFYYVYETIIEIQTKALEINPLRSEPYIPFFEHLLHRLSEKTYPNEVSLLSNNLALTYKALGFYKKAIIHFEKAVSIEELFFNAQSTNLATYYNNIASIYQDLGNLKEALSYQKKALNIREKVLGKEHPDLAISYNNIAGIYQDLGNSKEALTYQEKALNIREKVLGKEHPDLATYYNNIALIYRDLGSLEEALTYQKKVLSIREKILGKEHPDLATSYNNIAIIYKDLGKLEKALTYQNRGLAIIEKVLGKEHPDLASSYSNIASIYHDLGDLEEALSYQKKALNIREKVLGKEHPDLAISYNNIAVIYADLKDFKRALSYINKAVAIWKHNFPKGHPNLTVSLRLQAQIKRLSKKRR